MKALVYFSAIAALMLSACSTTKQARVAQDDIYYTPGDNVLYTETYEESSNDNYTKGKTSDTEYYTDEDGDTYITNNYYGDYNDYDDGYYSSRIYRFHRPYYGFSYYSWCYDPYWYSPGVNIYIGWGRPYYSYYRPWYSPYYYGYGYGYGYGYPYYGYGYGYPYYGGYNHAYWHGYNNGYYDGYYGYGYGSPYNNYYGSEGVSYQSNTQYGPRGSVSSNSGLTGNRSSSVKAGKTDGTGITMKDIESREVADVSVPATQLKPLKNIEKRAEMVATEEKAVTTAVKSSSPVMKERTSATEQIPQLTDEPRSYDPVKERSSASTATATPEVQSRTYDRPVRNYSAPNRSQEPVRREQSTVPQRSQEQRYSQPERNYNFPQQQERPVYTPQRRDNDRPTYNPPQRENSRPSYTPPKRESRPSYTPPKRESSKPSYTPPKRSATPPAPAPRRSSSSSDDSGKKRSRD